MTITDITQSVVPLLLQPGREASFAGTAFVADGYLITAAHVPTRPQPYYTVLGGQWLTLSPSGWIPPVLPGDKLGHDAIMYPLPDVESPLTLADDDAVADDEVRAVCWQRLGHHIVQVDTAGVMLRADDEQAYQRMATVERITHGASGCPVLMGRQVVGLVAMGRDHYELPDAMLRLPEREQRLIRSMEQNTMWVFRGSYVKRLMPRR